MSRTAQLVLAGLVLALGTSPLEGAPSPATGDAGARVAQVVDVPGGPVPTPGERPEPTRPGVRRYRYWEEEGVGEVVIDDAGDIYRRRPYRGVIPHVRDSLLDKKTSKPRRRGLTKITWIGFQQKALFSRIFIQTDRMPTYTIFKPDPLHIVVEFPTARLRSPQEARHVLTHEFNTRVDQIQARRVRGHGVHVVITLKEPTGYLYKQDGEYVFIDVER